MNISKYSHEVILPMTLIEKKLLVHKIENTKIREQIEEKGKLLSL